MALFEQSAMMSRRQWLEGAGAVAFATALQQLAPAYAWVDATMAAARPMPSAAGEAVVFAGSPPGETFTYRFPIRQGGTYWYHSRKLQQTAAAIASEAKAETEQKAMAGAHAHKPSTAAIARMTVLSIAVFATGIIVSVVLRDYS